MAKITLLILVLCFTSNAKSQCQTDWLDYVFQYDSNSLKQSYFHASSIVKFDKDRQFNVECVYINPDADNYIFMQFNSPLLNEYLDILWLLGVQITISDQHNRDYWVHYGTISPWELMYYYLEYRDMQFSNYQNGELLFMTIEVVVPEDIKYHYGMDDDEFERLRNSFCPIQINVIIDNTILYGGYNFNDYINPSSAEFELGRLGALAHPQWADVYHECEPSGGSGIYSYQWEKADNLYYDTWYYPVDYGWLPISGATSKEYVPLETGKYRRKVTDSEGRIAYTIPVDYQIYEANCSQNTSYKWNLTTDETHINTNLPVRCNFNGGNITLTTSFEADSDLLNFNYSDYVIKYKTGDGNYVLDKSKIKIQYIPQSLDGDDGYFQLIPEKNLEEYTVVGDLFLLFDKQYSPYWTSKCAIKIPFIQYSSPQCQQSWLKAVSPASSSTKYSPETSITLNLSGENLWQYELETLSDTNYFSKWYELEVLKVNPQTGYTQKVPCNVKPWVDGYIYLNTSNFAAEESGQLQLRVFIPDRHKAALGLSEEEFEKLSVYYCSATFGYTVPSLENPPLEGGVIQQKPCQSYFTSPQSIGRTPALGGKPDYKYLWEFHPLGETSWNMIPGETSQMFTPTVEGVYRRRVTDANNDIAFTNDYLLTYCKPEWEYGHTYSWKINSVTRTVHVDTPIAFSPEGNLEVQLDIVLNKSTLPESEKPQLKDYRVLIERENGSYDFQLDDRYLPFIVEELTDGRWGSKILLLANENSLGETIRGMLKFSYKDDSNKEYVVEIPFFQETLTEEKLLHAPVITRKDFTYFYGEPAIPIQVVKPAIGGFQNTLQWEKRKYGTEEWQETDTYLPQEKSGCKPIMEPGEVYEYRLKVTSQGSQVVYSNVCRVNHYTSTDFGRYLTVGGIYPHQVIPNPDELPSTLYCSAPASNGKSDSYVYTWQKYENNTWSDVPGTTSASMQSYTPPRPNGNVLYRLKVKCEDEVALSNELGIITILPFVGGRISGNQELEPGEIPNLIENIEPASGSNCEISSYIWECSFLDNQEEVWVDIPESENDLSYLPEVSDKSRRFRRKVTCTNGEVAYSNTVVLLLTNLIEPYPGIPDSFEISTEYAVGEIPINSVVSPTGSLTYNVPIEVLPGLNGLQPNVSLAYNSNGGNGILGVGWNLGGLSSIVRKNSTIHYDSIVAPIILSKRGEYKASFSLDGTHLVQLEVSESSITYATEVGNTKVVAYTNDGMVTYFKVLYPNGMVGTFGYEEYASSYLAYPITKLVDINGNYMTFTYDFRKNHHYISKIEYGGSESTKHFASVAFRYKKRHDNLFGYSAGVGVEEDYLLNIITTYSENLPIRTYTVDYTENERTGVSQLSKINCEAEGMGLNPLKFYYGLVGDITGYKEEFTSYGSPLKQKPTYAQLGKSNVNGDYYLLAYKEQRIEHRMGRNANNQKVNHLVNRYHPNDHLYISYNLEKGKEPKTDSLMFGDWFIKAFAVNIDQGPGDEIVKINNKIVDGKDIVTVQIYKHDPNLGLNLHAVNSYDFGGKISDEEGTNSIHPKSYFMGDFDGDGVNDMLVMVRRELRENPPIDFYLINFEEGGTRRYLAHDININLEKKDDDKWEEYKEKYNYYPGANDQFLFLDYDGDGITDICFLTPDEFSVYGYQPHSYHTILGSLVRKDNFEVTDLQKSAERNIELIGDINNDGKTDIICRTDATEELEGYWSIYYSKGANGFDLVKVPSSIEHHRWSQFILQDINRDGLLDIVEYGWAEHAIGHGKTAVYLNKNGVIEGYPSLDYGYASGVLTSGEVGMKVQSNSQILLVNDTGITKLTSKHDDGIQQQISGAVNSLGVVSKTWSKRLNNDKEYHSVDPENPIVFPYQEFNGPLSVVKKTETFLNGKRVDSITYAYDHAVIHKHGLGFLGFRKFHVTNQLRGITTTKTFDPLRYSVPVQDSTPGIGKVTYEYDIVKDGTLKVLLKSKTEENYISNIASTSSFEYDEYGNVLQGKTVFSDGESITSTASYINKRSDTENVLGLPTTQTQARTNGTGKSWSTRAELEYDSKNRPIISKQLVNDNQASETRYTYNGFGLVESEKVKTFSSPDWLETTYQYSDNGRFLKKQVDPMGLATTYDYDTKKALLVAQTDYLGNTTSYDTYDAFRRLLFTSFPDGTIASTDYEWANGEPGMVYKISQTATQSPKAEVYYDALSRELRGSKEGFDGIMVSVNSEYDKFGRLYKKSNPYKANSAPAGWAETTFVSDNDDRAASVTYPTGKAVTYSYSGTNVTTNDDWSTTREYNSQGELVKVSESAEGISNQIAYFLRPDGQPDSIQAPDGHVTKFRYDDYGRQTMITDPSAGTLRYTYDERGNMDSVINARGQATITTYNKFGLPTIRETEEMRTEYTYDTTDKKDYSLLSVVSDNGTSKHFTYDSLGRVASEVEVVDTVSLETAYTYTKDKLTSVTYSKLAGRPLVYSYNNRGYIEKVDLTNGPTIWTLEKANEFGQPESVLLGNGLRSLYTYSTNGFPVQREVTGDNGSVQRFSYTFNEEKKLLLNRVSLNGASESFTYDGLHRLTSDGKVQLSFNNMGSPEFKTDAGTLTYNVPNKPYAVGKQEFDQSEGTVKVRYIRDWLGGNKADGEKRWVEIQAINGKLRDDYTEDSGEKVGANVALGKPVVADFWSGTILTDGSTNSDSYITSPNTTDSLESVTVDLGKVYDLSAVKVWHYYADRRSNATRTEISEDGETWRTLYDSEVDGLYTETPVGRTYSFAVATPLREQVVSYASFERPLSIAENGYRADFLYDASSDRRRMNLTYNGEAELSRYYLGSSYEKDVLADGKVVERLYLAGSAYSAVAVWLKENDDEQVLYIHHDYLGSITHLTDSVGNAIAEYSYDAWGRMRNPQTLEQYGTDAQPMLLLGRGYTGHEHLPWFGLVNMNARLYDPVLGRFVSPDPYIQFPDFSQNFNRFGYALNNPLVYIDQNGEIVWFIAAAIIVGGGIINWAVEGADFSWEGLAYFGNGALATAATMFGGGPIAGGFITAAGNNAISQAFSDQPFNINQMVFAGIIGAATGYAGGQIAGRISSQLGNFLSRHISSPLLRNIALQTASQTATGFGLGTAVSLLNGNDVGDAIYHGWQSAKWGIVTGLVSGTMAAQQEAKVKGVNIVTGEGEGMKTPSSFAKDLTPEAASIVLEEKYGKPLYNEPGKKVYFNSETGRSFTIHTDPTHGLPHLDINTRGWPKTLNPNGQAWNHQKFNFKNK